MRCNPGHSHRHIHHHHHHSHCGPCYGGSVFTVSHHCGGHSGGFWGGFGAGLGMGLGNMLGGFMNSFTSGFGNMFSGFGNMFGGFGNMFGGFGMGGFGFGMPMMGGFGMGGFGMPWAASYGGGTVKDDAYFASRYGTGKSSSSSSSSSISGNSGGDDEGVISDTEIKIDGAVTKIETINDLGDIKNLTDAEIDNITKEQAYSILQNIGYIESSGVGKISTEYVVLKLLEKSGVIVECANNSNAVDTWIKGKITNVKKDEDTNKLSYNIDCNGVSGAMFGYKYTFKQTDNYNNNNIAFKVTAVYKNGSSETGYLINEGGQNRDYYYDSQKGCLVKITKTTLISKESDESRQNVLEKDANSA